VFSDWIDLESSEDRIRINSEIVSRIIIVFLHYAQSAFFNLVMDIGYQTRSNLGGTFRFASRSSTSTSARHNLEFCPSNWQLDLYPTICSHIGTSSNVTEHRWDRLVTMEHLSQFDRNKSEAERW
jgi:hypothetical protein